MDGWQAAQNWLIFATVAGGLAYYYAPRPKATAANVASIAKESKKEARKAAWKAEASTSGTAAGNAAKPDSKKRKANTQPAPESAATLRVEPKDDQDDIDMSTRQFAANMQKARVGIQVNAPSSNKTRVKTVKPKNGAANMPEPSSGSSQADADEDWPSAASPAAEAGDTADMLEPTAPGPSALRITASEKPVKEKAVKHAKKDAVETKKQRQNRKRVEQARLEREEQASLQKALAEKQRRTAREARGEPAKNGIPVAPLDNPWVAKNAVRDAQLPINTSDRKNVQLLDTLDTESNSSSNQEASTAATSTTDTAPSRWADDMVSEDHFAKAVEESERETGWSEVKSNKKKKGSRTGSNGDNTVPSSNAHTSSTKTANKPVGFHALADEHQESSNWAA